MAAQKVSGIGRERLRWKAKDLYVSVLAAAGRPVALGAFILALPALGQNSGPRDSNPVVTFLIAWFPILLILGIWFWFMRRLGASRYKNHIQRSVEHMDRVEQQNVEILSTLRSIESELKNRRQ